MNTLGVAVAVAATHRLTTLVVEDEITRPIREAISRRWPGSRLEYLVGCPACTSVWAGMAVFVAPRWVRGALALSAGTLAVKWVAEVVEASNA